jgi:homoserine acetyltransferase
MFCSSFACAHIVAQLKFLKNSQKFLHPKSWNSVPTPKGCNRTFIIQSYHHGKYFASCILHKVVLRINKTVCRIDLGKKGFAEIKKSVLHFAVQYDTLCTEKKANNIQSQHKNRSPGVAPPGDPSFWSNDCYS